MIHIGARARVAGMAVVATAAASTMVLAWPAAGAGQRGAPGAPVAAPPAASTTVTLLTGDRVTLTGSRVQVRAAKGREHIRFVSRTDEHGDTHVLPQDVAPLVASGTLDPRLFDVTGLVRDGYDDAHRGDLPLIVDYPAATPRAAGAKVTRNLPTLSAVAVRADKDARYWAGAGRSAKRIWLDGPVRASLDHSVPQIGAPEAWAAGHTGKGTTVAVLDTGIDASHPDLADAVAGARDFTGSETGTDDHVGHGTHVASIITGSGAKSGGKFTGVAPDAKLLNGKVLGDSGGGDESGIIAGMEWAAASGADVVNMSLGGGFPSDGTDPMSQAVNRLTKDTGTLFVIAAGNGGGEESISSPGAADAALTVGAVDDQDRLAEFSSGGPRYGDGAIKPDITAPGVDIVAAQAAHAQPIGEPAEDGYMSLSGTSMATPHVAGAAAILAGEHPDWAADRLKAGLMATAKPAEGESVFRQGAGRVDVAAAVRGTVSAAPPSVSAGVAQWPHEDDAPIVKKVGYTNSGDAPVTLSVAANVAGPGGAAPAGMITVSPASVTVPAGGQADVTVTIDTRVPAPDGVYTGALTATGGAAPARTPIAVTREVESYDVTVTALDHDGKATPEYFFRFVDVDRQQAYAPYDESGTVVARIPKGRYYLDAFVQTIRGETDFETTQFAEPNYVVGGDSALTLDARKGKPIGFTVDKPKAEVGISVLGFAMRTAWGETGSLSFGAGFDGEYVAPSTTRSDAFELLVEGQLAEPDGSTGQWRFHNSPYLYHLRWTKKGSVPATLTRTVHDRQLAKAVTGHATGVPGMTGMRSQFLTFDLPYTLTELYTPGEKWYDDFQETADVQDIPATFQSAASGRTYPKGEVTRQRWNNGVFGPAFPVYDLDPSRYAARLGDEVRIDVPLHSDRSPVHDGYAFLAEGTTELLRDGEPVGSSDFPGGGRFTLPADDGAYTLRTTATRGAGLSTSVSGEWAFRSSHVDGDTPAPLSLLALRFAPELDSANAAPRGKFRFPVYVQRNGSAKPGRVDTPTVEVSYDDGTTWSAVRLTRDGSRWVASVDHPAKAAFVSLRGSVADRDGNSVKETVVRAYTLR
jgi:hypothetical protein